MQRLMNLFRFATLLFLGGGAAYCAYEKEVTWSSMGGLNLRAVLHSPYGSADNLFYPTIPESAHEIALADSDERVAREFRVSESMKPAVSFWLKIYTEYTTRHVVLFDSHHPELVYEVLDFRTLAKEARNAAAYEIISKNRVRSSMQKYRLAFSRLSKNPRLKNPTREEKRVLAAVRNSGLKIKLYSLAKNLRSQTGQRDNLIKGRVAASSFFPKMEKIFSRMGLPAELTRIALVESSFDLSAHSRLDAIGVWQFMHASGKEYLIIDSKAGVDERLSPIKATFAAAKLLKRNHSVLKTWPLAITSYNHGLKGLFKPARIGGDAMVHLSRLGWAGRNYYAEFLAVVLADSYSRLFFGDAPSPEIRNIQFRRISAGMTAEMAMRRWKVSVADFKLQNPDIRDFKRALPEGMLLAIPEHEENLAELFLSRRLSKI